MKFIMTFRSKSLLITTVLILGLSIQASAAAGNFTTDKTNETYYSISEIPEKLFNRKSKLRDASFAILPDEVLHQLMQKQKTTLVDVRNPEDFTRLHIPGSLNIPLYAVKTKAFLKSFAIVLVNEGFRYAELENECRRLAERGFKVSILAGGLPAWKRKGGQLVGDFFGLDAMKTVSPQVFFREKDYENLLVVDISQTRGETSSWLIPYAKHIPVVDDNDGSAAELGKLISNNKTKPFQSIIIFNETGEQYEKAEKLLNRMGIETFKLQGGVAGYRKYFEGRLLSWKPRDSRIKTVGNCKPCGEKVKEDN
jgi:rhodanese-related sulfurtransferase